MSMLDQIKKAREEKEKYIDTKNKLLICPECKKPMLDNTFLRGNRLGGTMDCSCGFKIIF